MKQMSQDRRRFCLLAAGAFALCLTASGITVTDITGASVKPLENYEQCCIFTNSGSFTVTQAGTMDILVVGGGGAGAQGGGGGGGGGIVYSQSIPVAVGTYEVVVGAGGSITNAEGKYNRTVLAGQSSSIAKLSLTALGGGGGGWINVGTGGDGANGGGGSCMNNVSGKGYDGGKATMASGHAGGSSYTWKAAATTAGGGGGAGEDGHSVNLDGVETDKDGYGGNGLWYDISGERRCYGSGGGGGCSCNNVQKRKLGGEGAGDGGYFNGFSATTAMPGDDGIDGLGSGGGGGPSYGNWTATGGRGGSGVVIIRYRVSSSDVRPCEPMSGGAVTKVRKNGVKTYVNCFTNNGTLVVTQPVAVDVLLVGGGAGGGFYAGGGGGGGAVVQLTNLVLNVGSYDVVVGAGGVGVTNTFVKADMYGGTTTFLGYSAPGGGAGGWINGNGGKDGANGGGGGACNATKTYTSTGGTNTWAAGHVGGNGYSTSSSSLHGGGGGGAGEAGHSGELGTEERGYGGDGLACDFYGETRYYGGGGGGGSSNYAVHGLKYGGLGGGGMGGYMTYRADKRENLGVEEPVAGTPGTGGGGGGGWGYGNFGGNGANGGCGCVLIRYRAKRDGFIVLFK